MATSKDFDSATLDALVREAVVDAYGEEEQEIGLFTLIEDNVQFPFIVSILGTPAKVVGVEVRDRGGLVAVCQRGRVKQRVSLLDLPLPDDLPVGGEWILAYRRWAGCR